MAPAAAEVSPVTQGMLDLGLPAPEPMWAVSLVQPWAWFILRPDLADPAERAAAWEARRMKDGENRKWAPDGTVKPGGRLFLHAAATMTEEDFDSACRFAVERAGLEPYELPVREQIPLGGLVGYVTFLGVELSSNSPWFMGPKFWRLAESTPIAFRACPGKQSVFDAQPALERAAERRRHREYLERRRG